jgi:hypothetical protein
MPGRAAARGALATLRVRPPARILAEVAAFAAFAVVAGAALPAAPARASAPALTAPSIPDGLRYAEPGRDWRHCVQMVANLRAEPLEVPVVILLGGSSARESTIDDAHWSAQIERRGGGTVQAYNLGSKHRTFRQDLEFVKLLPKTPSIVYIGINIGRFCAGPTNPTITLPAPGPDGVYYQHRYTYTKIQSTSRKRAHVAYWMQRRYPEFKKNYAYNIRILERIILACQRRGLRVALVDLPRDLPVIGRSFDAAVTKYRTGCKRLARKYDVPWLNFLRESRFVNRDFFDIFHTVEPGRAKYQRLLSARTVRLLTLYGMVVPAQPEEPAAEQVAAPTEP